VAARPSAGSTPTSYRSDRDWDSGYTLEVELPDVGNLVPNSEVKFEDVTVGTVLAIDLDDWHARATVGLRKDVPIPSNAEARIGQKRRPWRPVPGTGTATQYSTSRHPA